MMTMIQLILFLSYLRPVITTKTSVTTADVTIIIIVTNPHRVADMERVVAVSGPSGPSGRSTVAIIGHMQDEEEDVLMKSIIAASTIVDTTRMMIRIASIHHDPEINVSGDTKDQPLRVEDQ